MSGSKLVVLGRSQASWIVRFTAGELMPSQSAVQPDDDSDAEDGVAGDPDDPKTKAMQKLQLLNDKDLKREMALKEKLINEALKKIAEMEESLGNASQMEFKRKGKNDWERFAPESGDQSGKDALELGNLKGVEKARVGEKDLDLKDPSYLEATTSFWKLQEVVKTDLAGVKVKRWRIPENPKPPFEPVQVEEKLFTDEEIAEEIYTPLVREKIIGDTIIPPQYSKTQKVLDSSDDYYIKECKEKGKPSDNGWAALTKSGIALGSAIASTVVSGMTAPSSDSGQVGNVFDPLSKGDAARINAITSGIASGLTGFVDLVDKVDTWKKGGEITAADVIDCMASITKGVAKSITSFEYNTSSDKDTESTTASLKSAFESAVTDTVSAGTKVGAAWVKWFKDGRHGSPPWDYTVENFGSGLASALGAVTDDPNMPASTSDKWSAAASAMNAAFPIFANAIKNQVFQKLAKGDKGAAFALLAEAGERAAQASFEGTVTNDKVNSSSSDSDVDKYSKFQSDFSGATDKNIDATEQGLDLLTERSSKVESLLGNSSKDARRERLKTLAEEFAKKKAEEEEGSITKEDFEKALEEEDKEFRSALVGLGKDKPTKEQDFKTIANVIAQIESDEALFKGITAMFGAGIGAASAVVEVFTTVASEVAPPLKAAGQLVKYCINIRAAMKRLEALDNWKETMEEAASAVSPYQTSIKRFISSQTAQRNHYYIQAGANAVTALLAAGEMSPVAPAFKAAGGAVTAAAALEEMIYNFRKQQELKRAWKTTKEAIDPANKDDRKMRLLARKLNPTLAKYTIAYGAVVEEDPVAIAAIDRIGLDRETLVNSAGVVKDVKKFLETLYPEDGSVYITLDAAGPPGFKAPKPELTPKVWALTFQAFRDKGMGGKNPPLITGNLAIVTKLEDEVKKLKEQIEPLEQDDEKKAELRVKLRAVQEKQYKAFQALETGFRSFAPLDEGDKPMPTVKEAALVYADLAGVEVARLETEKEPVEGEEINLRKAGRYKILNGSQKPKDN